MKTHPYADLFPMLSEAELAELAQDIAENGLRQPIVIDRQGRIMDGRNRFAACKAAGVEPVITPFEGDDRGVLAYIVSANLKRRHLNESQRAMIGARIAQLSHGGKRTSKHQEANLHLDPETPSIDDASRVLHVSPRSIKSAKQVRKQAIPEVVQAVENGKLRLGKAVELIKEPEAVQKQAVQDLEIGKKARRPSPVREERNPNIKPILIELLSHGGYNISEIVEAIQEKLPKMTYSQIKSALGNLKEHPPEAMALRVTPAGGGNVHRLVRRRTGKVDGEQAAAMIDDAVPLLKECIKMLHHPVAGREETVMMNYLHKVVLIMEQVQLGEPITVTLPHLDDMGGT
jgi:ParB-like chromosome segregation protein Spo0J